MIELYGYSEKNPHQIKYDCFTFPGGELQVKLDMSVEYPEFEKVVMVAQLTDSNVIMQMLLLSDAIMREFSHIRLDLKVGYLPYARQDRVCTRGEALSSAVMKNILSCIGYTTLTILDPHSERATRNMYGVRIRTARDMLGQATDLMKSIIDGSVMMVAPDDGATPRVHHIAEGLSVDYIQATKVRDTETGKLSGFSYAGDVEGQDLLIVDDICDGGGTFIGLTEKLLEGGAKSVSLYVSHGIFSKGVDVLYEGGISHIYTTNTISHGYEDSERFTNLYWS